MAINSDTLVEVKKNQCGNGLLIENDGFIAMNEGNNKKLCEDIESSKINGEWYCPYPFIVDAVFQKYGIKNANGRIYPEGILKKQVEAYQDRIKEKRAMGECNHPESSNIDLGRVSHNIIELHCERTTLVGKMELNITQGFVKYGIVSSLGDTVANLLLNGYKIGVSSRGVGSVEQDRMGNYIVGDDFELICWDVVENPSTTNAYIGSNHDELKPYIESEDKHGNVLSEKANKIKNILNS